jgi:hypothetical protein
MNFGGFGLLLALKLRLVGRTFDRRRGRASFVALFVLALVFAPIWVAVAATAYAAALHLGAPAVGAVIGSVHAGWVAGSLMLGSFAEGFDMSKLLRYPIRPRAAFWLNVLIAPLDLVALFVVPPLVAVVIGTVVRSGVGAGILVSIAIVVMLLTTSAVVQALLAILGRYVRREWTRALFGVLLAVAFALPTILAGPRVHGGGGMKALVASGAKVFSVGSKIFQWFPTVGLPVRAAMAAAAGDPRSYLWLVSAVLALVLFTEIGMRLAVRDAMNRSVGGTASPRNGESTSRPASGPAALLPQDLAVLVEREVRYFLRTPQILIGLPLSPLLVFMLPDGYMLGLEMRPFMLAFVALVAVLNLSANQFGLDQTGVRLLFLLPVPTRRILLAKNIACAIVVGATATLCLTVASWSGTPMDFLGMLTTLVTVLAALPIVLSLGNVLSVYHPWRMTFRLGGAPPGAMLSAFAQLAGVASVGFLLAFPMIVLPVVLGSRDGIRLISIATTLAMAGVLWLFWRLVLGFASRALYERRSLLIDRLVRVTETG